MTSRTIEARQAGPVVADLSLQYGRIEVIVERRDRAEVTLTTPASRGPAVDAVKGFALRDTRDGFRAHLEIPPTVVSGGGTTVIQGGGSVVVLGDNMHQVNHFSGSGSVVQIGGSHGSVVVGGGNVSIGGGSTVEMQVRLPERSAIVVDAAHCPVLTQGRLGAASINFRHGNVQIDEVGALNVQGAHGSVTVNALDGDANLHVTHGNIDIHALRPCRVRARTRHGNITVSGARVDLDASAQHGSVRNR
ncbi:hypothetical protein [Micromonospora sp. NPDC047730]|uniref:hypothetical protein n=1 Tax=Micromonospora sp. NPDC047730 TaxID=3364253 RepID=UPI003715A897